MKMRALFTGVILLVVGAGCSDQPAVQRTDESPFTGVRLIKVQCPADYDYQLFVSESTAGVERQVLSGQIGRSGGNAEVLFVEDTGSVAFVAVSAGGITQKYEFSTSELKQNGCTISVMPRPPVGDEVGGPGIETLLLVRWKAIGGDLRKQLHIYLKRG